MSKRRAIPLRFEGELNEPIETLPFSPLRNLFTGEPNNADAYNARNDAHVQCERDRKLTLLLEHFGIAPNSEDAHKELALKLAIAFVPGFHHIDSPMRPVGRPTSAS